MRYLLLASSILALAGCAKPTAMPSGYTYLSKYYKSPPAAKADNLGYTYTPGLNNAVMSQWQSVAIKLVNHMQTKLGITPQHVYLGLLSTPNAFNSSLDYALRDELRARGYILETEPGSYLEIQPQAWEPENEYAPGDNVYNGDLRPRVMNEHQKPVIPQKFIISLTLLKNNSVTGKVRDKFILPTYGYEPGQSWDQIYPPVHPMEKK
jgi:hypothetical protein